MNWQKLSKQPEPAQNSGNEAVLDRMIILLWEQCPDATARECEGSSRALCQQVT